MGEQRLALVYGATGAQGGSVAAALLATGRWRVRAATRDPRSAAARALATAGAEVVRADLAEGDSLRLASAGASAVFLATNFWQLGAAEYELSRSAVRAALAAGAGHVVFSSLPESTRRSGGRLSLPHHDGKARLAAELAAAGAPVTFVQLTTYYQNWPARRLRRTGGGLTATFPYGDRPLASASVDDLGGVVTALLEGGAGWHGRTVEVVGDVLAPAEYARILSRVLGIPVSYVDVPAAEFRALPFPHAAEIADMFEFERDFMAAGRAAARERTYELYPKTQDFESWARQNTHRFARLPEEQPDHGNTGD